MYKGPFCRRIYDEVLIFVQMTGYFDGYSTCFGVHELDSHGTVKGGKG
jgi:hypothetical protein